MILVASAGSPLRTEAVNRSCSSMASTPISGPAALANSSDLRIDPQQNPASTPRVGLCVEAATRA